VAGPGIDAGKGKRAEDERRYHDLKTNFRKIVPLSLTGAHGHDIVSISYQFAWDWLNSVSPIQKENL